MKHRKWQHVDNVANVFLASYNNRDTRVMRVCCNLKEDIKPDVLQEALDIAVKIRPQFQVKLHRGLFWRYMEESSDRPVVREEKGRICPPLYFQDRTDKPLYKVKWFHNRISMDIFHGISDGKGAMEFLIILVTEYLRRLYPDEVGDLKLYDEEPAEKLSENSFKKNYEKDKSSGRLPENSKLAYHPSRRKLPYDQLQFFELHMPVKDIKDRAKTFNVSISSYIGAALILAYIRTMPKIKSRKPIAIAMPINLRSYYESSSVRNFFNNVTISHTYTGTETLRTLSEEFQKKLKEESEPEKVKSRMNYFQSVQNQWAVRAVPLFLKEQGLGFLTRENEKRVSGVLSSMGVVRLPEVLGKHLTSVSGYCSSENPFIVICTFKDTLTLGISYPYADPKLIRCFTDIFVEKGIPVRLYATEVVR